jgi:hypothetical protein
MLRRDPPLAEEVKAEKNDDGDLVETPVVSDAVKLEALKREAEQGAQMPGGPQAQNLTPAKQAEHEEKGLISREAKQAQDAESKGKKK